MPRLPVGFLGVLATAEAFPEIASALGGAEKPGVAGEVDEGGADAFGEGFFEVWGEGGFVDDPEFVFSTATEVGVVEGPAVEGAAGGEFESEVVLGSLLDDGAEGFIDGAEGFSEEFVVGGSPGDGVTIEHCSDGDIDAEDGLAPSATTGEDVEPF